MSSSIGLGTGPLPSSQTPSSGTAAVKVQQTVSSVGERHSDLPDSLLVRIGIRTGLVYHDPRRGLGEFASRTVDQAGHLEKDCPPGQVHIGGETAAAVADHFSAKSVGKNRDDVEVFQLDLWSLKVESVSPPPKPTQAPKPPQEPEPEPLRTKAKSLPAGVSPLETSTPRESRVPQPVLKEPVAKETAAGDSATGQAEKTKTLFVPKNPSGKLSNPVEKLVKPELEDLGRWWGWQPLTIMFAIWWVITVLNFPEGIRNLIGTPLVLSLFACPFYSVVVFFKGKRTWARQSAAAFCVFVAALFFIAASQM